MSYQIKVKPGHSTGVRRRSGQVFTSTPVEVASVTDEMRADPWLQIMEIPVPDSMKENLMPAGAGETSETSERNEESEAAESGAPRPARASRASRK